MNCESLVRSRYDKERGCVRLRNPEPCGDNASMYNVSAKQTHQRKNGKEHPAQGKFMQVENWKIAAGASIATVHLCDKHKRKAEREGKEVIPA